MTCSHVLARIDAVALADWAPHELAAAARHARDCAACRTTLAAARELDAGLHLLVEPALPAGLAAAIVARTARVPDPLPPSDTSRIVEVRAGRDRPAWAAALVGLAVALGARVYSLAAGEAPLAFPSARIAGGTTGPLEMPGAEPAVLVLAAGLVLYLVGLLASLRGTARRGDPPAG